MKKIMVAIACMAGLLVGGFMVMGTYNYAVAQGVEHSDAGVFDAGPDAGPYRTAAPVTPRDPAPASGVSDPVEDPGGFAGDALSAYRAAQYAFFVVLALFGLSRGLLYVGDKYGVAMLRTYRTYILFVSAVLGGAVLSVATLSTIDLRVVLGAIASAAVLELRGAGKMTLAARAESMYNAYLAQTGGRSAVTGVELPAWAATTQAVRDGWLAAARAV